LEHLSGNNLSFIKVGRNEAGISHQKARPFGRLLDFSVYPHITGTGIEF